MKNQEKFEAFKKDLVQKNHQQYGQELEEKYGKSSIEKSNAKMMNLSEQEYDEFTKLGQSINTALKNAMQEGNPACEKAKAVAQMHKKWLMFTWATYSPAAHKALADTYVNDPRFTAYYDKVQSGAAKFLRDAIYNFCE